jgi:hypothetical protein
MEYMVFAREDFFHPTQHQGDVSAEDAEKAAAVALEQFGDSWADMRLIPTSKIHWALRGDTHKGAPDKAAPKPPEQKVEQ